MDITISLEVGTIVLLAIVLFSSASVVRQGYVGVTAELVF
jgi:regulator of protease activity HflC (stomatin/prohibitin superfamily)